MYDFLDWLFLVNYEKVEVITAYYVKRYGNVLLHCFEVLNSLEQVRCGRLGMRQEAVWEEGCPADSVP